MLAPPSGTSANFRAIRSTLRKRSRNASSGKTPRSSASRGRFFKTTATSSSPSTENQNIEKTFKNYL